MSSKTLRILTTAAAVILASSLIATGCMVLNDARDGLGLNGDHSMIGATPTSNFSQTGEINFSSLGPSSVDIEADGKEVRVEVLNDDGSFSECQHVISDGIEASEFNSLALLIDDSGSMELSYASYDPNPCPTCPHDVDRRRVDASRGLILNVHEASPESRIALMDFGPGVTEGWNATRVLADFTMELNDLDRALELIDGSKEAGTPLWDSLAEIVLATENDASVYENILQTEGRKDEAGAPATVARYLVVLSDGDDRDSIANTLETVVNAARANNVTIHAIGLGPASAAFNSPLMQTEEQIATVTNLQRLADATGGFYASVHDASGLEELYARVAKSLTEGYVVDTYTCLPNGKAPMSGQKVEGRTTVDGESTDWTVIAP